MTRTTGVFVGQKKNTEPEGQNEDSVDLSALCSATTIKQINFQHNLLQKAERQLHVSATKRSY